MNFDKIMYWHNGLFLKPHHFQYIQMYTNNYIKDYLNYFNNSFGWGLADLDIDLISFANDEINIKNGFFRFKDGSMLIYPKNTIINSRNFKNLIKNKSHLKCFIGLKKINSYESNVSEILNQDEILKVDTRFVYNKDKFNLENNLFEDNDKTEIVYLDYYAKIIFENEIEIFTDYEILPLFEIENKEGKFTISKTFIPPIVNILTSYNLESIIQDIYNYMYSYANKLDEYKYSENIDLNESFSRRMLILKTIIVHLPTLLNYLETKTEHPNNVYMRLKIILVELSIFSNSISISDINNETLIKKYNHSNIYPVFNAIKNSIYKILDEICTDPIKIIKFENENGIYSANLLNDFFTDKYDYFISFDEVNLNKLDYIKISNIQKIYDIVGRSLPGLEFSKLENSFKGLPKKSNIFYIKLDTNSEEWIDIKNELNISLHLDGFLNQINTQLFIVRK